MKLSTIVKSSFASSLLIAICGAYLKSMHLPWSEAILLLAIIASFVFIISAIMEVRTSARIDHREKTMWTVAFILMGGFAGMIYFIFGRRRIA